MTSLSNKILHLSSDKPLTEEQIKIVNKMVDKVESMEEKKAAVIEKAKVNQQNFDLHERLIKTHLQIEPEAEHLLRLMAYAEEYANQKPELTPSIHDRAMELFPDLDEKNTNVIDTLKRVQYNNQQKEKRDIYILGAQSNAKEVLMGFAKWHNDHKSWQINTDFIDQYLNQK